MAQVAMTPLVFGEQLNTSKCGDREQQKQLQTSRAWMTRVYFRCGEYGHMMNIAQNLALKALRKGLREIHQDLEKVAVVDAVAGVPGAGNETKRRRVEIPPPLLTIPPRSHGRTLHL